MFSTDPQNQGAPLDRISVRVFREDEAGQFDYQLEPEH